MPNTDLCTAAEKSEIHILIEKSLTRLKGPFLWPLDAAIRTVSERLVSQDRIRNCLRLQK
jgi:hypothetical protein